MSDAGNRAGGGGRADLIIVGESSAGGVLDISDTAQLAEGSCRVSPSSTPTLADASLRVATTRAGYPIGQGAGFVR